MKHFGMLLLLFAVGVAGCAPEAVDDGAEDFARGQEALNRGEPDFKAAMDSFAAAAVKNATNFEARLALALTALRLGEPRIADKAASEAVALDASSAEAWLVEGQSAYLMKDYPRAKASFAAVTGARELPAKMRSEAFSSLAVVEIAAGEIDSARISLMRAMRLDFRNAAAWYHLGVLSRGTFHFNAAALDQFEMACRLDSDSARTRNIVRNVIPSLRDSISSAAADKPGASKRDPGLAAKLLAEGVTAKKKKDLKTAVEKFAKAREADPLSWEAACNYAETLIVAEGAKKPTDKTRLSAATVVERTLAAYRDALDAKPTSRETFMAAARFALQNKRPQAAADFLSRALAHFPESKGVLDLYIESLRKLGNDGVRRARLYQAYRQELGK